jgi:REP-associated tyrosine transposase
MARISRVVVPEYAHHITQRGVRFMAIFQTDEERRSYLNYLGEEAARFEVEILAWCLMTSHVHFIAVSENDLHGAPGWGCWVCKVDRAFNGS